MEGKPVDYEHMMRCQRAALTAAAFTKAQQSDIIAAYSETLRDVQKVQAEVDRLQARLMLVGGRSSTQWRFVQGPSVPNAAWLLSPTRIPPAHKHLKLTTEALTCSVRATMVVLCRPRVTHPLMTLPR